MTPDNFDRDKWVKVYNNACWDMRACQELPKPDILYDPDDPSPFCLNWHEGARPHLNAAAVPKQLSEEDKGKYFGQCAKHEIQHYKVCPFDVRTRAALIDASTKALRGTGIPEDHLPAYAELIENMFADVLIDSWRREGYGKEPNKEEVEWWRRELMEYVKTLPESGQVSRSTNAFHKTYEELWNADLGVEGLKPSRTDVEAAKKLASVMGVNYKDSSTWYDKIREFSRAIGPLLYQDATDEAKRRQQGQSQQRRQGSGQGIPQQGGGQGQQQGSGQGKYQQPKGIPVPGDGQQKQDGSQEKKGGQKQGSGQGGQEQEQEDGSQQGEGRQGCDCRNVEDNPNQANFPIDIRALAGSLPKMNEAEINAYASEAYRLNEKSQKQFKTVMLAAGVEEGEARRYWYRTKAGGLMDIKPSEKAKGRPRRTYYGKWQIGDPIEDLDIAKSIAISPEMMPGRTTFSERHRMVRRGSKKYFAKPDMLIVRDSSGSMSISQKYESANVGCFAALDLAGKYGARVAAMDFSSDGKPHPQDLYTEWTTDYRKAENVFLAKEEPNGGTVLPAELLTKILKSNKDAVHTVLTTDAEVWELQNQLTDEAEGFMKLATSGGNRLTLLHIIPAPVNNAFTQRIEELGGQIKTIRNPDDVAGTILGTASEIYEQSEWGV